MIVTNIDVENEKILIFKSNLKNLSENQIYGHKQIYY